jgi:hypothetical protein
MPGDMPNNNGGRPFEPEAPGPIIAAEMLKNLVLLNANIEKSHQIYERLADTMADLADYHETYMRAAEIIIEKSEQGRVKFTGADLAKALAEAAEDVMGEGEEEDEPGEEDPLVRSR